MSFTDDNRKHFEFLQNIITRMNSNSFMIKGWAVGIVSALLAFAASTKDWILVLISILPIVCFWILDSQFLVQERKFRSLYNEAIKDPSDIPEYDLNIERDFIKNHVKNSFCNVFWSKTIRNFYLSMFVLVLLATALVYLRKDEKKDPVKVELSLKDTIKLNNIHDTCLSKVFDTIRFTCNSTSPRIIPHHYRSNCSDCVTKTIIVKLDTCTKK